MASKSSPKGEPILGKDNGGIKLWLLKSRPLISFFLDMIRNFSFRIQVFWSSPSFIKWGQAHWYPLSFDVIKHKWLQFPLFFLHDNFGSLIFFIFGCLKWIFWIESWTRDKMIETSQSKFKPLGQEIQTNFFGFNCFELHSDWLLSYWESQ